MNKHRYLEGAAILLAVIGFFCLDRYNKIAITLMLICIFLLICYGALRAKVEAPTKETIEVAEWADVDPYKLRNVLNRKIYSYTWSHGDSESATYTADFTEEQYIEFVAESMRQKIYVKLISKT